MRASTPILHLNMTVPTKVATDALDTSGLLCLLHKDEPHHEQAKIYFGTAACLTQSYILAEFIALCNARGLPSVCIREAVCL
jgi:hypothetical protein